MGFNQVLCCKLISAYHWLIIDLHVNSVAILNGNDAGAEVVLITDNDGVTPQSSYRFRQRTFNRVKIEEDSALIETVTVPVRLSDKEDFYVKQRNPFWTATDEDVQGNFFSNKMLAYTDGSFVIRQFVLDYLKRPRRMSKALNQDCELHSSLHQTVVEHTVAYLLEVSGNPRLQTNVAQRTYYGE